MEVQHALQLTGGVAKQIYFEPRKPAGAEHFYGLLHATKNRFLVTFQYHKLWEAHSTARRVRPLALKEFRSRWYLLALEVLRKRFAKTPQLDVSALYHDAFGILTPDDDAPHDVVLWFEPVQARYVRTFPLHPSQRVESEDADGLTLRLRVRLTHDFVMELLFFGPQVKVLKPAALIREMRSTLQAALAHHGAPESEDT